MEISQILKTKRTLSFEVFPPKKGNPLESLKETLNKHADTVDILERSDLIRKLGQLPV